MTDEDQIREQAAIIALEGVRCQAIEHRISALMTQRSAAAEAALAAKAELLRLTAGRIPHGQVRALRVASIQHMVVIEGNKSGGQERGVFVVTYVDAADMSAAVVAPETDEDLPKRAVAVGQLTVPA